MNGYTNPPYYLSAYGLAVKHGYTGTEEDWVRETYNNALASSKAAKQSAEDSEAWAVGQREGEDIPETDPAYHNNAAYHAATASAGAGASADSASTSEAFGAGTRGGAPVTEGDPAYQNNAPYFNAQAEDRAEDAEAWAIGQRGGTDVPDTDQAHNNNSKYYADLAKDYAEDTGGLVTATVEAWLDEHHVVVDPENYVIDNSLSTAGEAADAKATGDAIGELAPIAPLVLQTWVNKVYWQGDYQSNGKRITFINPIISENDVLCKSVSSGYVFMVTIWVSHDYTDGYISQTEWESEYIIPAGKYYTILIKHVVSNADVAITPAEHTNIIANTAGANSEKIAELQSQVNHVIFSSSETYVNKTYQPSSGTYISSNKRLIFEIPIKHGNPVTVHTSDPAYQFIISIWRSADYTDGRLYATDWVTTYTIPQGAYYNITIRHRVDNADVDISPAESSNIYLTNECQYYMDSIMDSIANINAEMLFDGKRCISDDSFVGVNAQMMAVDETRGIGYMVYMGSRTAYGEASDCIALSVFPLANPTRFKTYIVAENGVDGIVNCYEPNILMMDNSVRIQFSTKISSVYTAVYRDFDKTAHTFGAVTQILYDDNSVVNTTNTSAYLTAEGYDVSGMTIGYQAMTNTFVKHGDYIYFAISSHKQNPIICRSDDNLQTVERMGVMNLLSLAEVAIEFIGDRMYLLVRNYEYGVDNFFYSDDYGETFTSIGRVNMISSKPAMCAYDGKIIMVYNVSDSSIPTVNVRGRKKFEFDVFDGTDRRPFLTMSNYYGLVYPQIINFKGQLLSIFSEGNLFYDDPDGGDEGKDIIDYLNIGRLQVLVDNYVV